MVRFDYLYGFCAGFDDIGVNRSLTEEFNAFQLSCFLLEYANKFRADDFTLLFGVGNACQLIQEAVNRIHINQVCIHFITEHLNHLFGLALAQQTVVYMHAGQLLADGTNQKRRNNRGIHAAGERQQNLFIANLTLDEFNLVGNEVFHVPVGFCLAGIEYEMLQNCFSFCIIRRESRAAFMVCL